MQGVGEHAKAKGVPVLGLSGGLGKDAMDICKHGVCSLMTTVNGPMPIEEAIERACKKLGESEFASEAPFLLRIQK
jgi:glycerate kinase